MIKKKRKIFKRAEAPARPRLDTQVRYPTCPPGCTRVGLLAARGTGRLVQNELNLKLEPLRGVRWQEVAVLRVRNQELTIVDVPARAVVLCSKLRTVDDVFVILSSAIKISESLDLRKLARHDYKKDILSTLPLMGPRRATKKASTSYWVFIKQHRDHDVYRREIAEVLVQTIGGQFSKWRPREPADVEFWGFYIDNRLWVGMRLSGLSLRQRNYRSEHRPGALRPPLAAGLVAMSEPRNDDRVLDPMCGSGTILIERALWGGAFEVVGGDIDAGAVKVATASAKKADTKVKIFHWDATDGTEIAAKAGRDFDRIICNLPFGKQFQSEDLVVLYRRCLEAWRPLMAAGGKMILLTSETGALRRAAVACGLRSRVLERIDVLGIKAAAFELW